MLWRGPKIQCHSDVPGPRATLLNLLANRESQTPNLAGKDIGRWRGNASSAKSMLQSDEVSNGPGRLISFAKRRGYDALQTRVFFGSCCWWLAGCPSSDGRSMHRSHRP